MVSPQRAIGLPADPVYCGQLKLFPLEPNERLSLAQDRAEGRDSAEQAGPAGHRCPLLQARGTPTIAKPDASLNTCAGNGGVVHTDRREFVGEQIALFAHASARRTLWADKKTWPIARQDTRRATKNGAFIRVDQSWLRSAAIQL
jgi:hypothetical protein